MKCACGSGKEFVECCEPFLTGKKKPQTAEQLMRSRYVAFTLANMDYIDVTNHESTRGDIDREANEAWARQSEWLGLEILKTQAGGPNDDSGQVEFVVQFKIKGETHKHHELSEFKKEAGQWYFVDGKDPRKVTVRREGPKVGRNDPCPCGSGKKYKKCCGQN